jgi:methionyl-tRNA synthetase
MIADTTVFVNTARTQVDLMKLMGRKQDAFLEASVVVVAYENVLKQINGNVYNCSIDVSKFTTETQRKRNKETGYTKNYGSSCDKCANYQKCLITPKCKIDKYTHFVKDAKIKDDVASG